MRGYDLGDSLQQGLPKAPPDLGLLRDGAHTDRRTFLSSTYVGKQTCDKTFVLNHVWGGSAVDLVPQSILPRFIFFLLFFLSLFILATTGDFIIPILSAGK